MCDGYDENPLGLNTVEEPVGKSWNKEAPESTTEWTTNLRKLENPLVRALDRGDELQAKVLGLALEILGCRDKFVLCFMMKLDASHRIVERAFAKTSVAGIPTAFPD